MPEPSTKERILQAATNLFNESGTAAISTNHIAAALNMSPGNLYYHFRNKEEIIRAVVEQIIASWDRVWADAAVGEASLDQLKAMLRRNFAVLWGYRFFFRELLVLLQHDPELKDRFQSARQRRIAELKGLFQRYIGAGVLRPPDNDADLSTVLSICMLINNQWLIEVAIEGDAVTPEQIERGVALILFMWRPYLI